MRRFHVLDSKFIIENELSLPLAFVYEWMINLQGWAASRTIDGKTYYFGSKTKACDDLVIISAKRDTMRKYYRKLVVLGLVEVVKHGNMDFIHIVEKKRKEWGNYKGEESNQVGNTQKINKTSTTKKPVVKKPVVAEAPLKEIVVEAPVVEAPVLDVSVVERLIKETAVVEAPKQPKDSVNQEVSSKNEFSANEFLELWKEARLAYLGFPTHIKMLTMFESTRFNSLVDYYGKEDFIISIKGLFKQKNLFDSCKLRPTHFLEKFEEYLDCGHNNIQLYNKKKNNGKKNEGGISFDIN